MLESLSGLDASPTLQRLMVENCPTIYATHKGKPWRRHFYNLPEYAHAVLVSVFGETPSMAKFERGRYRCSQSFDADYCDYIKRVTKVLYYSTDVFSVGP
jgi:hypothetical protein